VSRTPETSLRALIDAFTRHDEAQLRSVLADTVTAYITTADGGVEPVHGRDAYVPRLLALQAPTLTVTVTQSVSIGDDQAMAMVEIRAERHDKTLHNFSAFLARATGDAITELWMVEALPAYSSEFWS